MKVALYLIVITSVMAAGCAPSSKYATPQTQPAEGDYDFRTEGKVPAPVPAAEQADVEEIEYTPKPVVAQEVTPAPPTSAPAPASGAQMVAVQGFRVQLFASQSPEIAEEFRAAAAGQLAMTCHVTPEQGLHKVRVGDFRTREEADAALKKIRAAGYPEAWVVKAFIEAPIQGQ